MLVIITAVIFDAGEGKGQPGAVNQIHLIRDNANYEIFYDFLGTVYHQDSVVCEMTRTYFPCYLRKESEHAKLWINQAANLLNINNNFKKSDVWDYLRCLYFIIFIIIFTCPVAI